MNRQTILSSIDRQLRENFANTGEVRPLGEIVPLVAAELRPSSNGSYTAPPVIPIERVAAFIDGDLTDEELQSVCQAAMFDNSVLAELIAGVRATQQSPALPPISAALTDRLLAMQPSPSESDAFAAVTDSDDSLATIAIESTSPATRMRRNRAFRTKAIAAILAIAATLLVLIFGMSRRQQKTPQGNEIVEDNRSTPDVMSDVPDVDPPMIPESGEPDPLVAVEESPPDQRLDPELDPMPRTLDPGTVARDNSPEVSPKPEPMDVVPAIPLNATPPINSGPAVARLANLHWTQIIGLLAERNEPDGSTGPDREATWKSVQADTSPVDQSPGKDNVAIRTLPLSRAEATLATGGKIVLAGDSGMQVNRTDTNASASIELLHGSVAMIDLPKGTVIDLRMGNRSTATLRWQDKGSAVLQRAASGLQIHIERGTIEVNNEPRTDAALVVADDRTIRNIEKPKRIPAWVDRPVDMINVPRPFLAQIAQSKDVASTLHERINALASQPNLSMSDSRTLATLANWQVAMAGPNVMRLGNSRHAILRMAALNRLIYLSNDDPRYRRTWAAIASATNNPRRVAQMRRLCAMARDSVRPNAAQVEVLLSGLSSPEISVRAMCDRLLRVFHGGGPVFDPTWTGQANMRGVNLWRGFAGRTTVRGANQAIPAVRDKL